MATGASTADLAVILIDARLGVQTQSKRHGFIASLLRVPRVVVTINKMDLVDYDKAVFDRIRDEYGDFAARLGFSDLTFIPISALLGDNVVTRSARMPWFEGTALLTYLENVYIGGDRNLIDFRFPVQRVVRPHQDFRGYSGQVASGVVRPGDEIVVLPSGQRSRVARIATFDGDLEYAHAPLSVTLCLADDIDVSRGDLIAHPNNVPSVERAIEAMVVWMDERPLAGGHSYIVKHATRTVRAACSAIVYRVDPDTLHRESAPQLLLNDIGRVRLTLFQPLCVDEYQKNHVTGSFIMVDPESNATVGAGMIIERRSAHEIAEVEREATVSRDITWEAGKVRVDERARLLGQEPVTIWLTGLSGSGKSTIARELERRLIDAGRACFVLDGDNLRHGLNRDLGFSAEDRRENIRRVAEVAGLMNEAGLIVVTAFISPYREDRAAARRIVGPSRFVEAYLATDLATCERRDPKGLYAKARRDEIPEFTGVSAPYETPDDAELILDTATEDLETCVARLLEFALPADAGARGR
jgi:bifunctional enzyme CysN/CysC